MGCVIIDGINMKLTLKDGQSGLDKIKISGGDTVLQDVSDVGTATKSIQLSTDAAIDSFDVYDEAGNVNEVTNIPIDRTKPTIDVTYRKGKCIIKATDKESGLWKIVDGGGQEIKDFSKVAGE